MRDLPQQQAPPVQRLRFRYTKRGRLRFTSHRDFSRAFERAIARARIPMAYSSGFNPHPRISYANASPTGAASEAEYVEIGLDREVDPDAVLAQLDAALPPGLDVVQVAISPGGSLADLLEASVWRTKVPDWTPEQGTAAVAAFLLADEVLVERMMKKGLRTFDCREAVLRLSSRSSYGETGLPSGGSGSDPTAGGEECAILDMVLRHGTPSVRPDDVLAGLRKLSGLEAVVAPTHERLAQGPLNPDSGTVGDPLALNRDTA